MKIPRKRLIEILFAGALILLGLALYLTLSREQTGKPPSVVDYRNTQLNEALTAYRMEKFDRAEMLFLKAIDSTRKRREKSIAYLYIGNIYFKLGNFSQAVEFYEKSLSFDGKNINALYNSALSFLRNREEDRALKYALKALEADGAFVPNLILLGNIYYATGRYTDALAVLEKSESSEPIVRFNTACAAQRASQVLKAQSLFTEIVNRNESSASLRGLACIKLYELTMETDYLHKALDVFPSSPALRYNLALRLYSQGQFGEVSSLLRSIIDHVDAPEVEWLYGRSLFMGGYHREALDFYTDVYRREMSREDMSLPEEGSRTAQIMGDIYLKLSETVNARVYYERAMANTPNTPVFLNLFRIALREGDLGRARALCAHALSIDREDPIPYMCEAEISFLEEDAAAARQSLEKAILFSRESPEDLMKIAAIYQQHGMYPNAVQIYQRILSIDPGFTQARAGIAEVYAKTGHGGRAIRVIEGIDLASCDREIAYGVMLLHARVVEDGERAKLLKELIRQFPDRYEAYLNLGLFLIEKGEYTQAEQTMAQCLERIGRIDESILSKLHALLGISQLFSGKEGAAIEAFSRSRELDADNEIPVFYLRLIGNRSSLL